MPHYPGLLLLLLDPMLQERRPAAEEDSSKVFELQTDECHFLNSQLM